MKAYGGEWKYHNDDLNSSKRGNLSSKNRQKSRRINKKKRRLADKRELHDET
jgi:hypothetical protein